MPEPETVDNVQLKLYELLIGQHQKKETVLWQLPTALLAINALAIERFVAQPQVLLMLAIFDAILTYAYHRVAIQQSRIADAAKSAESHLRVKGYDAFIPKFSKAKIKGAFLVVWALWALSLVLFVIAVLRLLNKIS